MVPSDEPVPTPSVSEFTDTEPPQPINPPEPLPALEPIGDEGNAYYGLGMACMKHLAFKEASAHLMNAIECEHLNHSEAGRVLHCMNALILCHLALRNLVEARKVLAEAERRYGRSSDPDVIAQLAQAKWMIKKGTEEAARQQ